LHSSGGGALAQSCPSSVPDFPSYPWIGSFGYYTTVDACAMYITYCYRIIPLPGSTETRYDYVVTSITPINPSCTISSPYTLITDASVQILSDNPHHFGFTDPCPLHNTYNYVAVQSTCWHIMPQSPVPGNGQLYCVGPCDVASWCLTGQAVCVDPVTHQLVILIVGHWAVGTNPCATNPPPKFGLPGIYDDPSLWNWDMQTCYDVNPCDLRR
jgi:hypothetical protein